MIEAHKLSKSFGLKRAVDNVTLTIRRGEYTALLGVNGAGKTTLVRLLATLTRPGAGRVAIAGVDSKREPQTVRRAVGVMSHTAFLYEELTAAENLDFYGKMYGVAHREERVGFLLNKVGLGARRDDRVRTFSRGMQQRLALARALLHDPPVLLLDEPFAGLDVNAADMLKRLLDELIADEHTVLLTAHDIDYALAKTHRILIMKNGALIADQKSAELDIRTIRDLLAG